MPRVVEILILVVSNLPQHQRDAELCSMFNLVLRNLQQAQELEHIHSSLVCLKTFLHKLKVSTDCTSQEIPVGLPACLTASCSLLETYCAALSHDESLIGLLCDIFIQIATILNTATLFVSMSQLVQRIFYDRKYIKCFETLGDLGVASISDGAGSMLIFIETALSLMRSPALTEGHPDLVEALCNSLRSVCHTYSLLARNINFTGGRNCSYRIFSR